MSARLFEPNGEWQDPSPDVRTLQTTNEFSSDRSTDHRDKPDEDLVVKASCGDHAAFIELSRRYSRVLKQRIYRIVQNYHDAEDILQDSLLKAYTHIGGFRRGCRFETWATRIALNSALMHLRKKRRRKEVSVELALADGDRVHTWDAADPSLNPEQLHERRQMIRMLAQALRRLPDGLREVVVQRHEQEIPLADAAKEMGITVAAAKSRLFRARRLLRRRLNMTRTDDSFVSCRS